MTNLENAKKIIENSKNWCRFTQAKNSRGYAVPATNAAAVQWDVDGACVKAGVTNEEFHWLVKACQKIPYSSPFKDSKQWDKKIYPSDFNDNNNHATVMKMFNLAIEMEKNYLGSKGKIN